MKNIYILPLNSEDMDVDAGVDNSFDSYKVYKPFTENESAFGEEVNLTRQTQSQFQVQVQLFYKMKMMLSAVQYIWNSLIHLMLAMQRRYI